MSSRITQLHSRINICHNVISRLSKQTFKLIYAKRNRYTHGSLNQTI